MNTQWVIIPGSHRADILGDQGSGLVCLDLGSQPRESCSLPNSVRPALQRHRPRPLLGCCLSHCSKFCALDTRANRGHQAEPLTACARLGISNVQARRF